MESLLETNENSTRQNCQKVINNGLTRYTLSDSIAEHHKRELASHNYYIQSRIGSGGQAIVYRVTHEDTRESYAAKAVVRSRFRNFNRNGNGGAASVHNLDIDAELNAEIQAMQILQGNKYCVKLKCVVESRIAVYLIMELLSGGDLLHKAFQTELSELNAISICSQILSALKSFNQLGIYHRDVKPENIMFLSTKTSDYRLKFIDFGLAHVSNPRFKSDSNPQKTVYSRGLIGTSEYLPPEVFNNEEEYRLDKVDIYGVGVMMYLILTGIRPFGKNCNENEREPDFSSKIWNGRSEDVRDFVKYLMESNANMRPCMDEALDRCMTIEWNLRKAKVWNGIRDFIVPFSYESKKSNRIVCSTRYV